MARGREVGCLSGGDTEENNLFPLETKSEGILKQNGYFYIVY